MRTTVNIDQHLLGEAKLIAAREHRTIGSVLEDALRKLLDDDRARHGAGREDFRLPRFDYAGGLRPGVDLEDKELMAELLGDNEMPRGI